MQEHFAYEKMPKQLKKLGADEKALQEWDKLTWAVTEKVHGANFSFVYAGQKLHFAKRKAYLGWGDDFFAFQQVVLRLESRVLALFEAIAGRILAEKIIIYGELFGGAYPHERVAPIEGLQAVQTGVYYAPDVEFCGFDIAILGAGGDKYYLDYEEVIQYFEQYNIFYARPLLLGKLHEVLGFDTHINSTIPAQFGLPVLDKNLMEGVVIKPYRHVELLSGAARPVVKLKNPEFDEEEAFHQAEKWYWRPTEVAKSEALDFWRQEIGRYLTAHRLDSAISKIGALRSGDLLRFEAVENEFLYDALADFDEENGQILRELPAEDYEWLLARLRARAQGLMRQKI